MAISSGVTTVRRDILVGLIGANIQNSLSPALFADVCEAAGLRGYYHLMDFDRLPGRSLEDVLGAVRAAGFAGVNVTYPFKEAVPKLLDEVSAEARQIGAVNTVTIGRDGITTRKGKELLDPSSEEALVMHETPCPLSGRRKAAGSAGSASAARSFRGW